MSKRILLYYKYVSIENPEDLKIWQRELCEQLELTGRIILAAEGINGTLCGTLEATQAYEQVMTAHPLFGGIDFKDSIVADQYAYFPRLSIKIKPELVHIGLAPDQHKATDGGQHLTPTQAHALIAQAPENLVILDFRNDFESRIGAFENAIIPDIKYAREFPDYVDRNAEQFKDKQVLMYCTGGVRCERASAYVKAATPATQVFQISGGVHRYVEQFPDGFFRGKNYVFDGRIAVSVTNDILGTCDLCAIACDEYTNCWNAKCNKHYIACPACLSTWQNTCSDTCRELVATGQVPKRPIRMRAIQPE